MYNYITKQSNDSTIVEVNINKAGFNEIIQYEFKTPISDTQIAAVWNGLSKSQSEGISENKQMFKQFIRAIKLAYPTSMKMANQYDASRGDEIKRIVCRTAKLLGYPVKVTLDNIVVSGTLTTRQRTLMFDTGSEVTLDEEEKIMIIQAGVFVIVATVESLIREEGQKPLYLYGMFVRPTDESQHGISQKEKGK